MSILLLPILPVVLLLEVGVLLWQEWTYYRYDADLAWMEGGDVWSGRLGGLLAQDVWSWGAGALVVAAYCQETWGGMAGYFLLASVVAYCRW